ncbi:MAG: endo-1,4-beta-xylanase [Opitutaceae bacterium]|nr:endo-1,4-beta-xylanase [Opitutaceae bacterium]
MCTKCRWTHCLKRLPPEQQSKLAERYGQLFSVYAKHAANLERITFWGVTDGDSWLNNWPIRGRTDYPLLFDRSHKPKPAFDAVMEALKGSRAE